VEAGPYTCFVLHKGFESALGIDCVVRTEKCGSEFVVALEVVLANIGNRRLTAPTDLSREPDRGLEESVRLSCRLANRRIDGAAATMESRFAKMLTLS
jgi:hypothetical protein